MTPPRARARIDQALRAGLDALGYLEVETPALVPAPGMEPHIRAFETRLDLGEVGLPHSRSTSTPGPEYAMKRLLAAGLGRIYHLGHVFRAEPPSATHNPEFTLLELYRSPGDDRTVMADLEVLLRDLCRAFTGGDVLPGGTSLVVPFERVTVREAFRAATGVDLADCPPPDPAPLAAALAARAGIHAAPGDDWDTVFFRAFLDRVEPALGQGRATYLTDYPAHMAALSRLRAEDPRWAARFELYAGAPSSPTASTSSPTPPSSAGASSPSRTRAAGSVPRSTLSTRPSSRPWATSPRPGASPWGSIGC